MAINSISFKYIFIAFFLFFCGLSLGLSVQFFRSTNTTHNKYINKLLYIYSLYLSIDNENSRHAAINPNKLSQPRNSNVAERIDESKAAFSGAIREGTLVYVCFKFSNPIQPNDASLSLTRLTGMNINNERNIYISGMLSQHGIENYNSYRLSSYNSMETFFNKNKSSGSASATVLLLPKHHLTKLSDSTNKIIYNLRLGLPELQEIEYLNCIWDESSRSASFKPIVLFNQNP